MAAEASRQRRRRGRKSDASEKASLSRAAEEGATAATKTPQPQPHVTVLIALDADATWYSSSGGGGQSAERNAVIQAGSSRNSPAVVQKYRLLADSVYRREVQLFGQKHGASGHNKDDRWVEATMRKGTLKDRIAAMSVVVSTDPIHKFYALDGLLQMTGCNPDPRGGGAPLSTNSRVAQLAAEAVEDLFLHTFLPPDRKLLTLAQRPLMLYETGDPSNKKSKSKKTLSPRILLLWRFEEMVKEKFDLFLRHYLSHTLQEGTMEVQKIAAVRSAAALLRTVPEAEAALLQMLVNKLGDPAPKIGAAAAHELRRCLRQHPAMQFNVAREVQQLAHRPHLSPGAVYHCVTFLNQLRLTRLPPPPPVQTAAADAAQTTEPSLAASLMGTYFRLFEFAMQRGDKKKKKTNRGGTGGDDDDVGRKSRLLSALLQGVNRAHPYLPAADQSLDGHVDALYRVVHTAPPGARTQSLLLLFHLAVGASDDDDGDPVADPTAPAALAPARVARRERFYRALYSTLSDTAMLGAGKHLTMYFNLLYKALKYDTDTSRLVAFAKRIWATALHCNSAVMAASIFLLNEVGRHHPVLLTCYLDVLRGSDALRVLDPSKREPRGALVSPGDGKFAHEDEEKRAPGWELSLTSHHFHPSVQKFASTMGEASNYTGDPLKDFALAPFLDKFAYRNPKSVERVAGKYKRGQSVGERRSGTDSIIQSHFSLPVNDPSFLEQSDVDVRDEFFHKFFLERAKRDDIKGIVRGKSDEEENRRQAELDALDREEARDTDHVNYGDLESQWETDDDEEAFVDSLAQKIIEDAMDGNIDELDNEDPNTEGWDDDDEVHDTETVHRKSDSEDDEDALVRGKFEVDDEDEDDDAFMDNEDDDSEGEEEALVDNEDDDAFMDNDDNSHNSNDAPDLDDNAEDDFASTVDDDDSAVEDDDDDEADCAFADDDESSNDDAPQLVQLPASGDGTFAAAEDYEELIAKSWSSVKRPRMEQLDNGGSVDDLEAPRMTRGKRKKRRLRDR